MAATAHRAGREPSLGVVRHGYSRGGKRRSRSGGEAIGELSKDICRRAHTDPRGSREHVDGERGGGELLADLCDERGLGGLINPARWGLLKLGSAQSGAILTQVTQEINLLKG